MRFLCPYTIAHSSKHNSDIVYANPSSIFISSILLDVLARLLFHLYK